MDHDREERDPEGEKRAVGGRQSATSCRTDDSSVLFLA